MFCFVLLVSIDDSDQFQDQRAMANLLKETGPDEGTQNR